MGAVSFASAGSGPDPTTPRILNVISYSKQLDYLRECKTRLGLAIGTERTQEVFENALFVFDAGNNDIGFNYYNPVTPLRRTMFTIDEYERYLLQLVRQFIQSLWELGARRILCAGVIPIGCVPAAVTAYSNNPKNSLLQRNCVESLNSVSRDYNQLVQSELPTLQSELSGTKIGYIDYYEPIIDIVKNPQQYGVDQVTTACCGTGLIETGPLCNPATVACIDNSKYVFWDSEHPTEKTFFEIFKANRGVIDYVLD